MILGGDLLNKRKIHSIFRFISFLKCNYPQCKIKLITSETNLMEYEKDLDSSYRMLNTIFKEISKYNDTINAYLLRIHGYKNWIVIRIAGNFMLPEKSHVIIKEANKLNALINIEPEDNNVVIKLAIEIS